MHFHLLVNNMLIKCLKTLHTVHSYSKYILFKSMLKCTCFSQGLLFCEIAFEKKFCFVLTVVNKTQQIVNLSKQSAQSDLFHSAWNLHKPPTTTTPFPATSQTESVLHLSFLIQMKMCNVQHQCGMTREPAVPSWATASQCDVKCVLHFGACGFDFRMFYCWTMFLPWSAGACIKSILSLDAHPQHIWHQCGSGWHV